MNMVEALSQHAQACPDWLRAVAQETVTHPFNMGSPPTVRAASGFCTGA